MTKRQLGILMIAAGLGLVLLLFAADLLGTSQFNGVGPVQRLAVGAALVTILIGLTLLPLGDRPA